MELPRRASADSTRNMDAGRGGPSRVIDVETTHAHKQFEYQKMQPEVRESSDDIIRVKQEVREEDASCAAVNFTVPDDVSMFKKSSSIGHSGKGVPVALDPDAKAATKKATGGEVLAQERDPVDTALVKHGVKGKEDLTEDQKHAEPPPSVKALGQKRTLKLHSKLEQKQKKAAANSVKADVAESEGD